MTCDVRKITRLVSILVFIALILIITDHSIAQFHDNIKVNSDPDDSNNQKRPAIVIGDNDTIHVVWEDDRDSLGVLIYYSRSEDGMTFDEDVRLSVSLGDEMAAGNPQIATYEYHVYVVWQDYYEDFWGNKDRDIFFRRSDDNGDSFETMQIINDEVDPHDQVIPVIAVDNSGIIYVVYWDQGVNESIKAVRSTDGGETFSSSVTISDSIVNGRGHPNLDIDKNGTLHVVWRDARNDEGIWDVYYSSSNDGTSFSTNVKANSNDTSEQFSFPRVTATRSGIFAAWDGDGENAYYSMSTDQGSSFGQERILIDRDEGNSLDILSFHGDVHIFYSGAQGAPINLFYINLSSETKTFGSSVRVNDGTNGSQAHPAIANSTGGDIHVSWTDDRNGYSDIYYSRLEFHDISISWWANDVDENGFNETYVIQVTDEDGNGVEADLWMDGTYLGLTGGDGYYLDHNMSEGLHVLNATYTYLSNSSSFEAEGNGPFRLRPSFEALDLDEDGLFDDLLINVNCTYNRPVEGVEIFIDSELVGDSNESGHFLIEDLEKGDRTVYVRLGRYSNESTFYSEGTPDPEVRLFTSMMDTNSSGRENDCTLLVLDEYGVPLDDVQVLLDGEDKGTTDQNGEHIFHDLGKGNHDIEVVFEDLENSTIIYSEGFQPAVKLNNPSDEYIVNTEKITLRWQGSDPDGDSLKYDIYFGGSPSPQLHEEDFTGTQLTIKDLEDNEEYYWQVIPSDDEGFGYTSEVRAFSVEINDPPCASLISPTNGSLIAESPITLTWSSQDEENDDLTFFVHIRADTGAEFEFEDIEETSIDFTPTLETGYTWYVIPSDTETGECVSGIWWFEFLMPNRLPVAVLEVPEYEVRVDDAVHFDASDSYDDDEDNELEYLFDFGDGEDSGWTDDPTVYHAYSIKGTFTVTLKVRDSELAEGESVTATITIRDKPGGSDDDGDDSIPGFETLLIVGSIIAVLITKRNRSIHL